MTAILPGRFLWHELLTSDPDAARQFYGAVVGWTTQPWGQDQSYTMWMAGETPVGGVMLMPDEVKAMGAPPHWLSYISTPDVDALNQRVASLGGKVLKETMRIPTVGAIGVCADPQGAVFCGYTPETPQPDTPVGLGGFSWHELATTDYEAAFTFYSALFGWEKQTAMDMGPAGIYQMYGLPGNPAPLGGMYRKPPEVPVAHWLPYALVRSADAAAETAGNQGGKLVVPPMEVPGGDRIAVAFDPQGGCFAVHSHKA